MLRTCSRPTWRGTSILGAAVGTLEVEIISLENNNQERIIKIISRSICRSGEVNQRSGRFASSLYLESGENDGEEL